MKNVEVTVGSATVRPPQVQFDPLSGGGIFADEFYEKELLKGLGVTDSLYFDCSIKSTFSIKIDGHEYVFPFDAIVDKGDGTPGSCSLNILGEGDGQFVIGDFFAHSYCHSFDIGNNRIGFGKNLVVKS